MNAAAQPEIIGLDVSRDWLDIHCLSDGRRLRLPNTDEGHSELEELAAGREALVCFEAAGGHEWRLWAGMAAAGVEARQLPPAQAEAFGRSRGASAKTDRIDAELIARFMAFRPDFDNRETQLLGEQQLLLSEHRTRTMRECMEPPQPKNPTRPRIRQTTIFRNNYRK